MSKIKHRIVLTQKSKGNKECTQHSLALSVMSVGDILGWENNPWQGPQFWLFKVSG